MTSSFGAEILYSSARTEVFRDGSGVVRKVPRGPGALRRVRHEIAMLARLDGVAGVPRLAPGDTTADAVAMLDCGGVPPTSSGCAPGWPRSCAR